MIALRNFIIHAYDKIEADILWDTIQDNLPPLQKQLQQILEEEEP